MLARSFPSGSLHGPGPVHQTFQNHESLARSQFERAFFEVDEHFAFHRVEELVVIGVLAPVVWFPTAPYAWSWATLCRRPPGLRFGPGR